MEPLNLICVDDQPEVLDAASLETQVAAIRADPEYVGQIGTTCVPTLVKGGHAENALPQRATANINCRIFPGVPVETVRAELEKIIADRLQKRSIGFGAHVADPDKRRVGELLEKSEPEDLLKFGLIPEFVGRLPVIATLHDLDVDALVTILQEPKNALVKQYRKLFELEDVELTFTDEALRAIAERAILRKTGARGLRSIVEGILLDTMFDLPDMEGVSEVVIDKDVVEGRKDPIHVVSGDAKKGKKDEAA